MTKQELHRLRHYLARIEATGRFTVAEAEDFYQLAVRVAKDADTADDVCIGMGGRLLEVIARLARDNARAIENNEATGGPSQGK